MFAFVQLLLSMRFSWSLEADESSVRVDTLDRDDECAVASSCGLSVLQIRANRSSRFGQLGTVDSIFTYGGPGTAKQPLEDLTQPDGVFKGLRCYTEDVQGSYLVVDAAAVHASDIFLHPKIAIARLRPDQRIRFYPGAGHPSWPYSGPLVLGKVDLHRFGYYWSRLHHADDVEGLEEQQLLFREAFRNANIAFHTYEDFLYPGHKLNKLTMQEALARYNPDWRVVAQEAQKTADAIDHIWLVQQIDSLDCVLAFTGTTTLDELFQTDLPLTDESFCGFHGVHSGFKRKLVKLSEGTFPKMQAKLGKCTRLSCAGHSLGAALCELFAACANSGRSSDKDFKRQMWTVQEPELMERVEHKRD